MPKNEIFVIFVDDVIYDFLLNLPQNEQIALEESLRNRTDGKWRMDSWEVPTLTEFMSILALGPDGHDLIIRNQLTPEQIAMVEAGETVRLPNGQIVTKDFAV